MTTRKVTAQTAFAVAANLNAKYQERGYGSRVIFVNTCPDCLGKGAGCGTCGNEPDDSTNLVKHGQYWYNKLSD